MIRSRSVLIPLILSLCRAWMAAVDVHAVTKISTSSKSMMPSPRRNDILKHILRGGQSNDPYQQPDYYNGDGSGDALQEGYRNTADSVGKDNFDQTENIFKESLHEKRELWRHAQMERKQNLTPEQEYNPRDEDGRVKLLSSVSKGSRAVIFFILLWRDIYLFEMTDQSIKGSLRKTFIRFILTTVLIGNIAGLVISVTSAGRHVAKKRLKAILNLDKVVESGLLLWNFSRATLFPSKYVEREIFIAGTLHCIFFIVQCQAFTRVTWDEKVAPILSSQKPQHHENPAYKQPPMNYEQGYADTQSYVNH